MALYPTDFDLNRLTHSERQVLQLLEKQIPDGSDIYPSVDGFERNLRREIDFVVTIPNYGVALIEVKNGLKIDRGRWIHFEVALNRDVEFDVADQLDAERRLYNRLTQGIFARNDPAPQAQILVITDLELSEHATVPRDLPREQIITKNQLDELVPLIQKQIQKNGAARTFNPQKQDKVHHALVRRGDTYSDYVRSSQARGKSVEYVTSEQRFVLDMLTGNSRVYIHGGPGTGKSVLAVEQACRLIDEGKKVAVLCFNEGLSRDLKRRLRKASRKPTFVGQIRKELPKHLGVRLSAEPTEQAARNRYWDVTVPKRTKRKARFLAKESRFDAIVVDEAQDLQKSELETLQLCLKDRKNGSIHLFGDPKQNVFGYRSEIPWTCFRARLMFNVRSSASIGKLLNALVPETATIVSGDYQHRKPTVTLVDDLSELEDAVDTVRRQLESAEWKPGDISIISTGPRLKAHEEARSRLGDDYWRNYADAKDVFYSRLMAYKGLERPAVILAFNVEEPDAQALRDALFIGAGRARDELALVLRRSDFDKLKDFNDYLVPLNASWD